MTNYSWTVSPGGTVTSGATGNSVTVTWNIPGAQTITADYFSPTGCNAVTPATYNVLVNPAPIPTIGSTNNPCVGSTNNIYYTESGQSNYFWTVTAGIIVSGQGTSTIDVTWTGTGSQSVMVNYNSSFGCSATVPSVYNLFVNSFPGAAGPITGSANLCTGTNGVAYATAAVANATSYDWNLPAGATIATGAGTSSITVNYGLAAVSGNITVAGNNGCGSGVLSPNFNVTIHEIPVAPVVTALGSVLTSNAAAGNQWYYGGTIIAGATSQSYTVTNNSGFYWCTVTLNGCSSEISNKVWITVVGLLEHPVSNSFTVYPMPNDGQFTVSIRCPVDDTFTILVYNQLGSKLYELAGVKTVGGKYDMQIDLRPITNGIYFVVFMNSENKIVRKIFINN